MTCKNDEDDPNKKDPNDRSASAETPPKRKRSARSSNSPRADLPLATPSMLTVGSRVLVTCGIDEAWFKATVKKTKQCEQDGKRSFLVHFDGNRRTNQSWIEEERVAGILFQTSTPTPEKSAEKQDSTSQFDPLGAGDIRERLRDRSNQIASMSTIISETLNDYNSDIIKLQDNSLVLQHEIHKLQSIQHSRDARSTKFRAI
jgi:hypothetical protein